MANYFNCSLDYLFALSNIKTNREYNEFSLNKFIDRYEHILHKNNISHYKFAIRNNISEPSLRAWRRGQTPNIETLIKIAICVNVSIEYLIGRVD